MNVPPWLGHLRRDRRGIPVPYINQWVTPGAREQAVIRRDPHVGRPAVYIDDYGDTPDFRQQNMARQRECTIRGLCQVCARPVPWSRRRLVVAALSVDTIDLHGRPTPVVTEPWLCERCSGFAVGHCPALIRKNRDEQLTVLRVTSKLDVRLVVSTGWVEGPFEAESRRVMPSMWAKLALLTHHIEIIGVPPKETPVLAQPSKPDPCGRRC